MMKINLENEDINVFNTLIEHFPNDGDQAVVITYRGNPISGNITVKVKNQNDYIKALKSIILCLEDVKKKRA